MRPQWSIALVTTVVAAIAVTACAARLAPSAPKVTPEGVEFVFVDATARSVSVAGSFNQWSATSHPLAAAATAGAWTIVVPMPLGEHSFMYVVDGTRWVTPPQAEEYVDDGFGSRNGVVIVRPVAK